MPEDRRFMPEKVRRPRNELIDAANQLEVVGYTVAGSFRRGKESVGDLDILVPPALSWERSLNEMTEWFGYEAIRGGNLKSEGVAIYKGSPLLLNLWRVPTTKACAGLLLFATGPYDLNVAMRARAKTRGLLLSQYGLFEPDLNTQQQLDKGQTEEEIFGLLQLTYLLPVEREDWKAKYAPLKAKLKVINVPSSKGDTLYQVQLDINGNAVECECKGYTYRQKCRHLKEAETINKLRNMQTRPDEL